MSSIEDYEGPLETMWKRGFDRKIPLLPRPHEQDHWYHVFKLVDKADRAYCEQKKRDLECLYRFALLLSCCLGTVIFDSYKGLFDNSSIIPGVLSPRSAHSFLPYHAALIIIGLWLVSLFLSVSTLLMCTVCQRSLEGFLAHPQFDAKYLLAFRQMRYNAMRRCRIFEICDILHLIIPLAFLVSFSGVILLLKSLNHPDLCVIAIALAFLLILFLAMGLHPFFWSLFARHFISNVSPFNSPLSWLLFKWGHSLLFRGLRLASHPSVSGIPKCPSYPELSKPPLNPISLGKILPLALTSRDWLEGDCSNFFHPDHAETIDVLLADALVWVESNPTIEKTSKLVASIYHCICDLKSPGVFSRLEYGLEVAQRSLAGIFQAVATREQLSKYNSRAIASALWIQMHVSDIPYFQLAVSLLPVTNTEEGFSNGYRPLSPVPQLLTLARDGLADGTYLEGTFNIIRLLVLGKINMITQDCHVQQLVFDILDRCEQYFKTGKYKNGYHRAQLCVVELQDFIRTGDDVNMSMPEIWEKILGKAREVHNAARDMISDPKIPGRELDVYSAARDMIPGPTRSDSRPSSVVSSRSSTLNNASIENYCSATVLAKEADMSNVM